MSTERVHMQVDENRVARVTLVRTEKSNALDGAMFDALIGAGERLRDRRDVRAVVLSGEGKGFCAGSTQPGSGANFPCL